MYMESILGREGVDDLRTEKAGYRDDNAYKKISFLHSGIDFFQRLLLC